MNRVPTDHRIESSTPAVRSPRRAPLIVAAMLTLSLTAAACVVPVGVVDEAFGNGGIVDLGFQALEDSSLATAVQSDGRIVVLAASEGPGLQVRVTRLLPDGTMDRSFGSGGRFALDRPTDGITIDVAVDDAGRIIVLAAEWPQDAPPRPIVIRLKPSGALDPSFGDGGVVAPPDAGFLPAEVEPLPGGRYAVAGTAFPGGPGPDSVDEGDAPGADDEPQLIAGVVMLTNAGDTEPGFGEDGIRGLAENSLATAVTRGASGNLLVTYTSDIGEDQFPGTGHLASVPDTGPGVGPAIGGTIPVALASEIVVDPAGRVLVAGLDASVVGTVTRFPAALGTDGAGGLKVDPSFGQGGNVKLDPAPASVSAVRSLGITPNGNLLGSAWFGELDGPDPDLTLFRLGPDGALDRSIGTGGRLAIGLNSPAAEAIISSGVTVLEGGAMIVPGSRLDGRPGAYVGKYAMGDPAPAPLCPPGPVLVTPENASGVDIARWICGMELIGTIWRGEGVLVVIPRGYFTCPIDPQRFWFDVRAEFGFFMLQAKCGYTPTIANTWFGPWFAWDPPR